MKKLLKRSVMTILSKKVQVSPHVYKITVDFIIFPVSIWIVENGGHYFMIDTGIESMAHYLVEHYFGKQVLEAVFLTHGHSDHVGGLKKLLEAQENLPVYIDGREFPYVKGLEPYPGRKSNEQVSFDVDCLNSLKDCQSILANADLLPVFAPGHSPGHTCYYHLKDKVLIAGDLLTTNRFGKLRPPMKAFTADMKEALKSAHQVLSRYPDSLLSVCHGGEVRRALNELEDSAWFLKK